VSVQIYLSYATSDDLLPPNMQDGKGFVTFLSEQLYYEFQQRGAPWPTIWRDTRKIELGDQFDTIISKGIEQSALLLIVLSPNWMESSYCRRELDIFARRWQQEGELGVKQHIVVACKRFIDRDRRPALLQGQLDYNFFAFEGPGQTETQLDFFARGVIRDDRYYTVVEELAQLLYRRAQQISTVGRKGPIPPKDASKNAFDETKSVSIQFDPSTEPITLYLGSRALVIGIDNYTNGWLPLKKAIEDAEAVAEALQKQGFKVQLERDLIGDQLNQVLHEWFLDAGQDEDARLLVWFAGHGHTLDRLGGGSPNAYIVGADAPQPMSVTKEQRKKAELEFRRRSLSLARFGEYMKETNARHVLVIFDSCFSGVIFSAARSAPPAISRYTSLPVRQFITSGTAGQTVSDDGMFRRLFIGAITGEDREADSNNDGYITGNELGNFLQQKVTNLTHNRQTPDYGVLREEGFDRGDFVFEVRRPSSEILPPRKPVQLQLDSNHSNQIIRNKGAKVVFVSYPKDIAPAIMKRLGSTLIDYGFRIWIYDPSPYGFSDDELDKINWQEGGRHFRRQTRDAVRSSDAVLFLISHWTLKSPLQEDELLIALELDRFVPCIVNDDLNFDQLPPKLHDVHVRKIVEEDLTGGIGATKIRMLMKDVASAAAR
jgi:hypothetical protein